MTLISHLDALEAKATKGPWSNLWKRPGGFESYSEPWDSPHASIWTLNERGRPGEQVLGECDEGPAMDLRNVEFIVALRNAWPAISAVLKAADALDDGYPACNGYELEQLKLAVRALRALTAPQPPTKP